MRVKAIVEAFPEEFHATSGSVLNVYRKQPGYAVHNRPFGKPAPGSEFVLNDGEVAVFTHETPDDEVIPEGAFITAVYSAYKSSSLSIPTGKIFVRFQNGTPSHACEGELRNAGFEILEVPAYAPQAAWIQHISKDAANALKNLDHILSITGIEQVEPQMLQSAARK